MLTVVLGKVGVPRQLVIKKDPSSIPYEVNKAGLKLPLGMFCFFFIFFPLFRLGLWGPEVCDVFRLSELNLLIALNVFVVGGSILVDLWLT